MRATSVICDQFGTEYIAANSRARRRKHADVGKNLCADIQSLAHEEEASGRGVSRQVHVQHRVDDKCG